MFNPTSYQPTSDRQECLSWLLDSEHHQGHVVVKISVTKFRYRHHDLFSHLCGKKLLPADQPLVQTIFTKLVDACVASFSNAIGKQDQVVAAA